MTEAKERIIRLREAAVIALAAVLVYLPALRGGFVFDDSVLLVEQPFVHAADGLRRIWFTAEAPDYYPVTWTAWWVQWLLWGAKPLGFHIVNVLLHALNAVLVALVLRRLDVRGSWIAALIFAVHPVNVAAVAWISEQKTTLSMLFFLMTVLAYLRFERGGQWRWYATSVGCYLLSLLAKPAAVMWPVVLLGLALWKSRRVTRRDLGCCLPFVVLSAVIGLLTVWFQAVRVLGGQPARTDGFLARLTGAGWAVWFYFFKVAAPVRLTMIYPRWEIDPSRPVVYVPALLLVLLLAYCWHNRRSWGRDVVAGAGYYIVMLFPVLGFFDQGFYRYSFVADHWQYVPIIGVIALTVGGTVSTMTQWEHSQQQTARVAATVVIVCLGALTWNQSQVYFDEETLWRDTIAKNPSAWLAHYNLGVTLAARGKLGEAVLAYEAALRLKPDNADALNNLALALQGKPDEAIALWRQAVRCQPDHIDAHNNLGAAYAERGDFNHAALQFSLVLILKPDDAAAHANLGTVYLNQGKLQKAVEQFQAALRADPSMTPVRLSLGVTLARLARFPEASETFQEVLRVDPMNQAARTGLEQLGRTNQ
ncbi:MAG: tetratricopeptide repeat protein [Verrucomicrobiia bacterium]